MAGISEASIEFDIEETSNKATELLFTPAKFEFTAFDKLDNGDSLFDVIDSNLSSTDTITITFDFTTDGGTSWTDDIIECTKNDISYSRERREVSFSGNYILSATSTVSDIFVLAGTDTFNSSGSTKDCVPARDYINTVLSELFPGTTDINNTDKFSSDPTSGDTWVVFDDHNGNVYKQETNALSVLYRLAAVDGSVVGTMMGFNFVTNRLDTTEDVSISEDDVSSLDIQPGLNNYRHISALIFGILGTDTPDSWGSSAILFGDSDGLNTEADKQLDLLYYMLELQPAVYDGVNDEYDDDGSPFFTDTTEDLSTDAEEGAFQLDISGDPSLVEDDFMSFSDKYELYLVNASDASRLELKTPLRRQVSAQFSTGGNKSIRKIVSSGRQGLASHAIDCYGKAYGADGSRLIEITILDVDTLNPDETFTLGSSFPASVQNQTFRPSKLTYDYIADRIKINAYQIS